MNFKNNISLWLGLAIPVLMIAFVAGSIYLPRLNAPKPTHDFLYTVSDNFSHPNQFVYTVRDDTVVQEKIDYPEDLKGPVQNAPRLFRYSVSENRAEELSLEEAQQLTADAGPLSPDGFEVTYGNQDTGIFPFFVFAERDYNTLYITGHQTAQKLNISLPRDYYGSFQFLAWII